MATHARGSIDLIRRVRHTATRHRGPTCPWPISPEVLTWVPCRWRVALATPGLLISQRNFFNTRIVDPCVCRAPPTLAVSVRASYPHRLGDGSNLRPCPRIRGPFGPRTTPPLSQQGPGVFFEYEDPPVP